MSGLPYTPAANVKARAIDMLSTLTYLEYLTGSLDDNGNLLVYDNNGTLYKVIVPTTGNIQAALDLFPVGGGVVQLVAGTYEITSQIVITQGNIGLVGAGHNTVINNINGSIANAGLIFLNGSMTSVFIKDLQIDLSYLDTPSEETVYGVQMNSDVNDSTIDIQVYANYTGGDSCYGIYGGTGSGLNIKIMATGGDVLGAIDTSVDNSNIEIYGSANDASYIRGDNNRVLSNYQASDLGTNNIILDSQYPFETSWTPSYSASGSMTWTSVSTDYATYQRIGNRIHFQIRATGTTGGTASAILQFTAPTGFTPSTGGVNIGGGCRVGDVASLSGSWLWNDSAGVFQVAKYDSSNYNLGANKSIIITGSYPI